MLIHKLLRRFMNDEPGAAGGGSPAPAPAPVPVAEAPAAPAIEAAAPAATPAPSAAPAAETAAKQPEDFGGLSDLLDKVGTQASAPAAAPTAAPAPAATTAPTAPAAPAAKAPAQPSDELAPPEGMSERAAARWSQLTERVKTIPDLERRANEATQQLETVRRMVADSGLAPQEFTETLELSRMARSSDPRELQQALQRIDSIRADLATRLGAEVPGVDLLSQHPDLKTRVEGLTLSREDALEMIRLRTQNQTAQRSQQQQTEFQQFQQNVQQAAARMDATLAQRAATPGHAEKVAFIRNHFADPQRLRAFVETYQPQQWEAAVLMMYDAYTPPVAAVPAPAPAVPQPLRPGVQGAGQRVAHAPRNAMDAVQSAFAAAGL